MSTDHTSESSIDTASGWADSHRIATANFAHLEAAEALVAAHQFDCAAGGFDFPSEIAAAAKPSPAATVPPGFSSLDPSLGAPVLRDTVLEFRVVRSGVPTRRLRLTGNRYTFGSAAGCSIRLSDPDLRPMHAVLIRDTTRVLIRAYSVPILVNGSPTTEATLQLGDVLKLGLYQFELTELSPVTSWAGAPEPRLSTAPPSLFDAPLHSRRAPGPQSLLADSARAADSTRIRNDAAAHDALRPLPSAEDALWRERLRREIDQWRERQSECDRRESRCDERESNLRGRETELWSRAENLYRREARLQSQEASVLHLHDEFAVRQQELLVLREDAHAQAQTLRQRELELQQQEVEYRAQLSEAARQLAQSQQQSKTATEAVQRMREQFAELNRQIDTLSSQQAQLEAHELKQLEEQQRLRHELVSERDQAIDAQAESEARRRAAEARLEQMAAQIEALQAGQSDSQAQQQAKLQHSEEIAEQLQAQVAELQQMVADASEQSGRLRSDYQQACDSVRQLESLVAESSQRGDQDRESWAAEANELRSAIETLSADLAQAGVELSELREANSALSTRLDEMRAQRDEALAEIESRPSEEAFESLRSQLGTANEQLAELKHSYEETLDRLSQAEAQRQQDRQAAQQALAERSEAQRVAQQAQAASEEAALATAEAQRAAELARLELAELEQARIAEQAAAQETANTAAANNAVVDAAPTAAPDQEDDDVWPTYQTATVRPEPRPAAESIVADETALPIDMAGEADLHGDDHDSDLAPIDRSAADETAELPSAELQSAELPSAELQSAELRSAGDLDVDPMLYQIEMPSDDRAVVANGDPDATPFAGSLASRLIQDLRDEQAAGPGVRDTEGNEPELLDGQTPAEPSPWGTTADQPMWDREFYEESEAERWADETADDADTTSEPTWSREDLDDASASELAELAEFADTVAEESTELPAWDRSEPAADEVTEVAQISDGGGEDDDSIEAYMNRLLRRVQGQADSDDEPPAKPTVATRPQPVAPTTIESPEMTEAIDDQPDEVAEPEPIEPAAPLRPRSQAPERDGNLTAMRALANQSARSAISRSTRIQTRNIQMTGMFNFAIAMVAALVGIGAGFMLEGLLLYLAGAMAGVVAIISVKEGVGQFSEAARRMNEAAPESEDDDDKE